jgi:hypothetical protein
MTDPGSARTRGRPVVAVLAVGWVALGFWSIEDGRMWHGAAGVALGTLTMISYLWPDSALSRWMDRPVVRRRRPAAEVSAPDRG